MKERKIMNTDTCIKLLIKQSRENAKNFETSLQNSNISEN